MSLFANAGFAANVAQTASSTTGIRLSVSIIPAAIALVGAGLLFFYRLDEGQMGTISSSLNQRRAGRL